MVCAIIGTFFPEASARLHIHNAVAVGHRVVVEQAKRVVANAWPSKVVHCV
jgi:hypothetical protein